MNPHDDYDLDTAPGTARETWRRSITVLMAIGGLALIFVAGYALHGHTTTPAAATPTPIPPTTTVPTPSASGLPPTTAPGRDAPAGAMPHLSTAGAIVGYSHDEAGAVAAAGNYATALYIHTNRTPGRERAVLGSIAATPAEATRMAADFGSEDTALSQLLSIPNLQTPGTIAFGHPAGYRIGTYTAGQATIDVHVVGGQGTSGAAAGTDSAVESFAEVDRLQLTWIRGDWRLANWSRLVDNGPQLGSIAAQNYAPFPIGQTGNQP
jgi:hypothetical protein